MSLLKWIFPHVPERSVEGRKHCIQSTCFSKGDTYTGKSSRFALHKRGDDLKSTTWYNLIKLFQILRAFASRSDVLKPVEQITALPWLWLFNLGTKESQSRSRSSCGNSKMWNVGQRVVIMKSTGERSRDKTQILETFWSLIMVFQVGFGCQFPLMI